MLNSENYQYLNKLIFLKSHENYFLNFKKLKKINFLIFKFWKSFLKKPKTLKKTENCLKTLQFFLERNRKIRTPSAVTLLSPTHNQDIFIKYSE